MEATFATWRARTQHETHQYQVSMPQAQMNDDYVPSGVCVCVCLRLRLFVVVTLPVTNNKHKQTSERKRRHAAAVCWQSFSMNCAFYVCLRPSWRLCR